MKETHNQAAESEMSQFTNKYSTNVKSCLCSPQDPWTPDS